VTAISPTRTVAAADGGDRFDRLLISAAGLFTLAVLVHGADHLRRGVEEISRQVFWLGTAGTFLEVAVVALVCMRHRLAPLAAAVAGFSLAAGYVIVHFLPARRLFSDSFVSGGHVSALSWTAASFEVLAAMLLGVAGVVALRGRGGLASAAVPHPGQRDLRAALRQPVLVVMLTGSAALLVISFAQL
jgi:hypothetical protein